MSATPELTSARMSYAAAILACVGYGIYFVLAAICIHFLLKRRTETRSQKIILGYTICMLVITTIYFVSGCVWSEIEFVEATVDISVFDTLQSSSLAILKDTAYVVNIWLADSLLVYRLFIVWGGYIPVITIPCCLWVGTVATGIGLLVNTADSSHSLNSWAVIQYQTAFYSLTVSHNILCTLFIASRMWWQWQTVRKFTATGGWTYSAVIAVIIESAAIYSICGIVYIPLVVRMLPLQFPITALIGALTSIAPNLIILRIALGTAITSESTLTQGATFKLSTLRSATEPASSEPLGSATSRTFGSRTTIPGAGLGGRDVWGAEFKGGQFCAVIEQDSAV